MDAAKSAHYVNALMIFSQGSNLTFQHQIMWRKQGADLVIAWATDGKMSKFSWHSSFSRCSVIRRDDRENARVKIMRGEPSECWPYCHEDKKCKGPAALLWQVQNLLRPLLKTKWRVCFSRASSLQKIKTRWILKIYQCSHEAMEWFSHSDELGVAWPRHLH